MRQSESIYFPTKLCIIHYSQKYALRLNEMTLNYRQVSMQLEFWKFYQIIHSFTIMLLGTDYRWLKRTFFKNIPIGEMGKIKCEVCRDVEYFQFHCHQKSIYWVTLVPTYTILQQSFFLQKSKLSRHFKGTHSFFGLWFSL